MGNRKKLRARAHMTTFMWASAFLARWRRWPTLLSLTRTPSSDHGAFRSR